jgi:hypothetical protein
MYLSILGQLLDVRESMTCRTASRSRFLLEFGSRFVLVSLLIHRLGTLSSHQPSLSETSLASAGQLLDVFANSLMIGHAPPFERASKQGEILSGTVASPW